MAQPHPGGRRHVEERESLRSARTVPRPTPLVAADTQRLEQFSPCEGLEVLPHCRLHHRDQCCDRGLGVQERRAGLRLERPSQHIRGGIGRAGGPQVVRPGHAQTGGLGQELPHRERGVIRLEPRQVCSDGVIQREMAQSDRTPHHGGNHPLGHRPRRQERVLGDRVETAASHQTTAAVDTDRLRTTCRCVTDRVGQLRSVQPHERGRRLTERGGPLRHCTSTLLDQVEFVARTVERIEARDQQRRCTGASQHHHGDHRSDPRHQPDRGRNPGRHVLPPSRDES